MVCCVECPVAIVKPELEWKYHDECQGQHFEVAVVDPQVYHTRHGILYGPSSSYEHQSSSMFLPHKNSLA